MHVELVSLLAPNADRFHAALARYLGGAVGLDVRFTGDAPWSERIRKVASGDAGIVALCAGLCARRCELAELEAVAAPVPARAAHGRPAVSAELVVHARAPFERLADLRGARFALNDPESLSGHDAIRARLADAGHRRGFFSRVIVSGSHQASIDMVASDLVDVAVIDGMVLAIELEHRPLLGRAIRVLESLGPYPSPPLALSREIPRAMRERLGEILRRADASEEGRSVLALGAIARYAPVPPDALEVAARVVRTAAGVTLAPAAPRDPSCPMPRSLPCSNP